MSTTNESRADQILAAFVTFHRANPSVWELFCRFTFEAIKSGQKHYSSDCIFNRIRWHNTIETSGDALKLNDHYRAYYARLFHAKHPEHGDFFRNRKRLSEHKPAYENDVRVFDGGRPEDETWLLHTLSAL